MNDDDRPTLALVPTHEHEPEILFDDEISWIDALVEAEPDFDSEPEFDPDFEPEFEFKPRDYSDVRVEVETITPEQAVKYLALNFSTNRKKTATNVNTWAVDMKAGRWKLSTDCIAFDRNGILINGQNRLAAIEKAQIPAQVLVGRNFPPDAVEVLDLGKKRQMHERITIGGEQMMSRECSAIRNAMSRWSSRRLGTIFYSKLQHDAKVLEQYREHKVFMKIMGAKGYLHDKIPGFFISAALMICAEGQSEKAKNCVNNKRMLDRGEKPAVDLSGYDPLKRSLQFLEIVHTGILEHLGSFKMDRDGAAKTLYDFHRENIAKGRYWSTWECLEKTMKLAKKFQMEQNATRVKTDGVVSPFSKDNLTEYDSTNQLLINCVRWADYFTQEERSKILDSITEPNDQ